MIAVTKRDMETRHGPHLEHPDYQFHCCVACRRRGFYPAARRLRNGGILALHPEHSPDELQAVTGGLARTEAIMFSQAIIWSLGFSTASQTHQFVSQALTANNRSQGADIAIECPIGAFAG